MITVTLSPEGIEVSGHAAKVGEGPLVCAVVSALMGTLVYVTGRGRNARGSARWPLSARQGMVNRPGHVVHAAFAVAALRRLARPRARKRFISIEGEMPWEM